MIKCVSDIMIKRLITIDILDGIQKVSNIAFEKKLFYFPVKENDKIVGVLTYKDLLMAHPNRIVADVMSNEVVLVYPNTPIWKANEVFKQKNTEVILVSEAGQLVGIITKTILKEELGKHIDLLTGLYKSDYIYYNGAKLINENKEITILFIDINNFGFINKKYGHAIGDSIIKDIGDLIINNGPNEVHICRFGGDEFVIVTPYHADACTDLASKLLSIISAHKFYNNIPVSISIGIAGGKRFNKRPCDPVSTVVNLINLASLESTKAKKQNSLLSVAETAYGVSG